MLANWKKKKSGQPAATVYSIMFTSVKTISGCNTSYVEIKETILGLLKIRKSFLSSVYEHAGLVAQYTDIIDLFYYIIFHKTLTYI